MAMGFFLASESASKGTLKTRPNVEMPKPKPTGNLSFERVRLLATAPTPYRECWPMSKNARLALTQKKPSGFVARQLGAKSLFVCWFPLATSQRNTTNVDLL